MSQVPEEVREKFAELTEMPYANQAKWFLNGLWDKLEKHAEKIWDLANLFIELDENKAEGNQLDEFKSHIFLENLGQTLTVLALREKLRKIDIDNNKMMALAEYLIFRYKLDVVEVANAPQGGGNPEDLAEAESLVAAAQTAVEEMLERLEEQKEATRAMLQAEEEAVQAENENKTALQELNDQEEAYKNKIKELTAKSKEGGVVKRNRAKAELEQMKAEDPLPLRKAQLNQGAAVRKAEKARKAAEEARIAEEEAQKVVEEAVAEAESKLDEAMAYLEEVKKRPGQAMGDIWWMQREIEEKKKYLPKKKAAKM